MADVAGPQPEVLELHHEPETFQRNDKASESLALGLLPPSASPPQDCLAVTKDGGVLKNVLAVGRSEETPPPFARCLSKCFTLDTYTCTAMQKLLSSHLRYSLGLPIAPEVIVSWRLSVWGHRIPSCWPLCMHSSLHWLASSRGTGRG